MTPERTCSPSAYTDPAQQVENLSRLAQVLYQDETVEPARGRATLDEAVAIAGEIENALTRLEALQKLAPIYQMSEGEFPAGLIDLYFSSVETVREDLQAGGESGAVSGREARLAQKLQQFYGMWLIVAGSAASSRLAASKDPLLEVNSIAQALQLFSRYGQGRNYRF